MKLNRLIIIVLYRTDIFKSHTVLSIKDYYRNTALTDKVFIWDNSPQPQSEEELRAFAGAFKCQTEYRNTPGNISLAIIYNTIVSENKNFDFFFLFDQDSEFDVTYLDDVLAAAQENPDINLFVPLIHHGSTIISPGHFFYFKGKYWKLPQLGIVKSKNTVAITSGMAIKMRYMEEFGKFDERLSLYGIDNNFMLRYARQNEHFYVINTNFNHDLAEFKRENAAMKRKRFDDFKNASIINSKLYPIPVQWLNYLFLWYRKLKFYLNL